MKKIVVLSVLFGFVLGLSAAGMVSCGQPVGGPDAGPGIKVKSLSVKEIQVDCGKAEPIGKVSKGVKVDGVKFDDVVSFSVSFTNDGLRTLGLAVTSIVEKDGATYTTCATQGPILLRIITK